MSIEPAKRLLDSRLFDAEWYVREYPDVAKSGLSPVEHYLRIGSVLGRSPGPEFDAAWYLSKYPDVAAAAVDPLLHYLDHGQHEGRQPGPFGANRTMTNAPPSASLMPAGDLHVPASPNDRLPDLFSVRASERKSRVAVVEFRGNRMDSDAAEKFMGSLGGDCDYFALCPADVPADFAAIERIGARRKVILSIPSRYGDAAGILHLLVSGGLEGYDALCWLNLANGPVGVDVAAAAEEIRQHTGAGVIASRVTKAAVQPNSAVHRMLGIFPPRLGRKRPPADTLVPGGSVIWVDGLIMRQIKAMSVGPDELVSAGIASARQVLECLIGATAGEAALRVSDGKKSPDGTTAVTAGSTRRVKTIAFYLPQFHPIPENDRWWGKGFTEWTNVVKSRPLFRHHYQPRLPADLGYYDLRLPETQQSQAALAEAYGVHGFCYYYYWFNGKKLLNRPIEQMVSSGSPQLPFCVCWANENWSRNWDGQNKHVLLDQAYSLESNLAFIREMIPMMKDPRYIRANGKPVLIVYRIRVIPNWLDTARMWREECRKAGLGEIHLCAVRFGLEPLEGSPGEFGVDAYVLFPPHETRRIDSRSELLDLRKDFGGELFEYDAVVEGDLERFENGYPWPVHRGAMLGWDNTARRGTSARIFTGATPARFHRWLKGILAQEERHSPWSESLVFVNAWNEWAEGTTLEPDQKFGAGYLQAVRSALGRYVVPPPVGVRKSPSADRSTLGAMHIDTSAEAARALPPPSDVSTAMVRSKPIKPTWHAGDISPRLGSRTVLICAHISGHQLFGGERSFLDVLDAMEKMNLTVIATLPSANNKAYIEAVRSRTAGVYTFPYPQWVKGRALDEALVLCFSEIISRHDVALVHANTIVLLEPLEAARRMNRRRLIHSREIITLDESLRDRIGLSAQDIIRQVFERSDHLIANSLATASAFRRAGQTHYVPNAIRVEELEVPNLIAGKIKFAVVSSNIPKKGVADVIEVARLCDGVVANAEFLVIGPENAAVASWREEQKAGRLPQNIRFLGYRETPREAMAEANVVLNLSTFAESFGRTVAEALAARRPVIAYEWGALPELLQHGLSGYLVPYRDVHAVASRVAEICSNPEMISRMGDVGHDYIASRFGPDSLFRHLRDAYAQILGDPAAAVPAGPGAPAKEMGSAKGLTIVMPVYNACNEVEACLQSVLKHTDLSEVELLVINDGSTDPKVAAMLAGYEGIQGLRLVSNPRNLGYTKTVNIGIRQSGVADVILLNSDTIVGTDWIRGLRSAAYADCRIGTVTAMGDNAGAFSFPVMNHPNPKPDHVSHEDYAANMVAHAAACRPVEVTTGSGFCMYIRRELLDECGVFDEEAFPRGYGEENDFCMRARQAGWMNVITPWTFVFHSRSASFGAEKDVLVKQGVDVVTKRYPDYASLTKAAFSCPEIQSLRVATAHAADIAAGCG